MGASFEIPDSSLSVLLAPMMKEAGPQVVAAVIQIAKSVAEDKANGYMDKEEACQYLKLDSVRGLENWMKPVSAGGRGLPHFKIGETVRFCRARIDAWALTLERNSPPLLAALDHAA